MGQEFRNTDQTAPGSTGPVVDQALDQAICQVFSLLADGGHRDPKALALALLSLEARLEARFPPRFSRRRQRPLPFVFADCFLVQLQAINSDEIDVILRRVFTTLIAEPTLSRNIEQAILFVVAAHHGLKLSQTLAGCELDADLYVDVVEHVDGSRDVGNQNAIGFAFPLSSRSAFSPIAGYSVARRSARKRSADWAALLRDNPEFGVWAITLTMPSSPKAWSDYGELTDANFYRDVDQRFTARMRDLGMRLLAIGREIAFKADRLHVHRHILFLGLRPAIDAIHRAWESSLWPQGKPDQMPPAYVDVAEVVSPGGHVDPESLNRLARTLTYALKGQHLPAPWTAATLEKWGDFVSSVRRHPRRSSICKGTGKTTAKRTYSRAAHVSPAADVPAPEFEIAPLSNAGVAPTAPSEPEQHSEFIQLVLTETEVCVDGEDGSLEVVAQSDAMCDEEIGSQAQGLAEADFERACQRLRSAMERSGVDLAQLPEAKTVYLARSATI